MKYSSHWLENCWNTINMDHINFLLTLELTTLLKQDKEKWRVIFHTCVKLFQLTLVYVCIYYTYLCIYAYILCFRKFREKALLVESLKRLSIKIRKLELCNLQLYWKLTLTPAFFRDKKQLFILVLHVC